MTRGPERIGVQPGIQINDLYIERFATTNGTGRPVAERAAEPDFLTVLASKGIHIGDAPTRYTDSRAGTRMNDRALEALRGGETQQMFDSFAWLREKFFAYTDESPEQITDHHLWSLSLLGQAIPAYLILRAENPVDRWELPEVVGNIFKASVGFRDVARHNILHDEVRTYTSPLEVYAIADRKGLFHQDQTAVEGFTCAANEPLITRTADALLFGEGANPQRSQLADYISNGEFGNLVRFSEYNYQYINNIEQARSGLMSHEELFANMADLQNKVNFVLGRDPESVPPPTPGIPKSGPLHTAKVETYRKKQTLARERVIYKQRTTGKKKKR